MKRLCSNTSSTTDKITAPATEPRAEEETTRTCPCFTRSVASSSDSGSDIDLTLLEDDLPQEAANEESPEDGCIDKSSLRRSVSCDALFQRSEEEITSASAQAGGENSNILFDLSPKWKSGFDQQGTWSLASLLYFQPAVTNSRLLVYALFGADDDVPTEESIPPSRSQSHQLTPRLSTSFSTPDLRQSNRPKPSLLPSTPPEPVFPSLEERLQKYEGALVVVVDTNMASTHLINRLALLNIPGRGRPVVLLPWMTIKEQAALDCLSPGPPKSTQRRAKYFYDLIHRNDTMVLAQEAVDAIRVAQDLFTSDADDRILDCCLQARSTHHTVVLVTDDKGLCQKAHAQDITTISRRDLIPAGKHMNDLTDDDISGAFVGVLHGEGPSGVQQSDQSRMRGGYSPSGTVNVEQCPYVPQYPLPPKTAPTYCQQHPAPPMMCMCPQQPVSETAPSAVSNPLTGTLQPTVSQLFLATTPCQCPPNAIVCTQQQPLPIRDILQLLWEHMYSSTRHIAEVLQVPLQDWTDFRRFVRPPTFTQCVNFLPYFEDNVRCLLASIAGVLLVDGQSVGLGQTGTFWDAVHNAFVLFEAPNHPSPTFDDLYSFCRTAPCRLLLANGHGQLQSMYTILQSCLRRRREYLRICQAFQPLPYPYQY